MIDTSIKDQSELTVVVPVYNEAESLPIILPALVSYCSCRGWYIIIVNDGSVDATSLILKEYESHPLVKIFHHKINRGYGGAIKTGIRNTETELVVTIDADGQHRLEDIDRLAYFLHESNADMAIGCRKGQKGSNLYRELGKWIIRSVVKMMMPIEIYDINSGFKLYRTDLAKIITSVCPDTMAFSEVMTVAFIYLRNKVIEVPIQISKRIGGQSTISTQTAFQTVLELINITMLFRPIRVYFPISMIFLVLGLIWGMPIILAGRGVSVGAMLIIIAGILFLFIGLVCEQIALFRRSILDDKIYD